MSGQVVGYLELMIQKIRAENEELKKKNEELIKFGQDLLDEHARVCAEADEMKAFIDKVMQRVQEQEHGTQEAEAQDTAQAKEEDGVNGS
jgi:hypothetical protein